MERFLEDLILAQRAAGLEAFALVHQKVGAAGHATHAWLRAVPVWRELAFAPIAPRYLTELNHACAEWQPDIIHLHLPNVSALAVLLSRAARRVPWVIHWHSDIVASKHSLALRLLYPLYRPFEQALLERATLVICTSTPYLETSEPLAPYREKCVAVPLGLDINRLRRSADDLRGGPMWREGTFRLLAVGRLTYYKGFDTLIRAVALCPGVELKIVGEGADRGELTALIRRLNLSDRVTLEGELSDPHCAALYGSAELFCMPSRERTEAFGLVVLEAMANALPVLASDLHGSGLVTLVSEKTGALAGVNDPDAWRVAITKLRADRVRLVEMGVNGRARVERLYDISAVQSELQATIERTLNPDVATPEAHSRPLIVIPAKNEVATIALVVKSVLELGFDDVLVVDDASVDGTSAAARKAGARVIRAPLAQGAWGAMQTGIRYGVRHNFSSVVTLDADGQHRPEEIERLLQSARFSDVVIGACPGRGSRARKLAWSFFRKLRVFRSRI